MKKIKVVAAKRETSISALLTASLEETVRRAEDQDAGAQRMLARTNFMSAESREFVDTNVLIYAHDTSAASKHLRAIDLVNRLASDDRGALSVQVLQEFFVTVTGKLPQPLPSRSAAAIIADLATWEMHAPEAGDVLAAIDLRERLDLSFWDAMIVRSASRLGCELLWSEDFTNGRSYAGVEVRNPFA